MEIYDVIMCSTQEFADIITRAAEDAGYKVDKYDRDNLFEIRILKPEYI